MPTDPWERYRAPNIADETGSKYGITSGVVSVGRMVFETSVNTATGNASQAIIDIGDCGGEPTGWDL